MGIFPNTNCVGNRRILSIHLPIPKFLLRDVGDVGWSDAISSRNGNVDNFDVVEFARTLVVEGC